MQSSTPTDTKVPDSIPRVAGTQPGVNKIVDKTAMHSELLVRSVHEWFAGDFERLEQGTTDSIDYLSRGTAFVMDAVTKVQGFAHVCTLEKERNQAILEGISTVLQTLRAYRIDTTRMEGNARMIAFEIRQLEVMEKAHADTAAELVDILARLQPRVDALLSPSNARQGKSRLN